MKLQAVLLPGLLLLAPLASSATPSSSVADKPGITDHSAGVVTQFSVQQTTQIPGHTLKPGSYDIRIVDHLSDRLIIRVEQDGKTQATFLALPSEARNTSGPILLGAAAGAKAALKGFAFANGTVAEFVYPKTEAVGLAKANRTRIPAIDPASEGRPANNNLSEEDYELVTLWLLSPTTVGPDAKAGILAQRYHSPEPSSAPQTALASNSAPAAVYAQRAAPAAASPNTASTANVASAPRPVRKPRPVMAALPHTASSLPLVWLTALLALCGAMLLSARRLARVN